MSVIIRQAICCDSCKRRFEPSFEAVANTRGITKALGTSDARREAMLAGWTKRKVVTKSGLPMTIDLCKDCKPYSMDGRTIWFQSTDESERKAVPKKEPCEPGKHSICQDADGVAVCVRCHKDLGWYCPISTSHLCDYSGDDEGCIHCGTPEERQ